MKAQGMKFFIDYLYVDDMIYTENSLDMSAELKIIMSNFEMTDLGLLHYFLKMKIIRDTNEIFCVKENMLKIC